ncbi:MAG: YqgE/AlgH family protein [Alphaproteobacteria bacterium]|nr:YqgE/AlgH family protein [Alphaproteobacteria bacterium]
MGNTNNIQKLTGKLLLSTMATPSDKYLSKSIVLVCQHSKDGAMGLITNKVVPDLEILSLLNKTDLSHLQNKNNMPFHLGGTENTDKCFVIHSNDFKFESSRKIDKQMSFATFDDLFRIPPLSAPKNKIACVGCCSWEPGQLEDEVGRTLWIPLDADKDLIFGNPFFDKWRAALFKIGSKSKLLLEKFGNA